jgi:Ran GTPase-activating protein (RanGAP) involved in mRNA processing and transport
LQIVTGAAIRVLSIDQNQNIPEACYGQFLLDDVTLKNLSIRGGNLTDVGCKALANTLKTNRTLISLNLFDNKITKDGAEAIAEALKFNPILTSLSLGRNHLGDEGACFLAKVLYHNARRCATVP